MGARLKSSVLRREERGFGSISMGRLIISGMVGGMSFFAMRLIGLTALMIPVGIAAFIAGLIFTNLKHGILLYRRWFITFRARLLMDVTSDDKRWRAQIAKLLDLDSESLVLDTAQLLSTPNTVEENGSLDEWEIVPDSADLAGFEVLSDSLQLEVSV